LKSEAYNIVFIKHIFYLNIITFFS